MTGQDLTTTAIISLENFLADNTKFKDFDDIMVLLNKHLVKKLRMQYLDMLIFLRIKNYMIISLVKHKECRQQLRNSY